MTNLNADLEPMQNAIRDAFRQHWKLFMFQGALMLLLGLLAIAAPALATIAVELYIGWFFLIAGVVGLIALVTSHHIPAFLFTLVTAALLTLAGGALIARPVQGAITLTLILTVFFAVEGIFQIAASIAYRGMMGGLSSWMLLSGLADLIMVAIIVANWPASGVWVLGLLAGVNLFTSGWATLAGAFAGRAMAKHTTP